MWVNAGVAQSLVYDRSLYILAGLLLLGLACNLVLRPVDSKHYITAEELAAERALQHDDRILTNPALSARAARGNFGLVGILSWAAIAIPFLIGVYIAIQKAAVLI